MVLRKFFDIDFAVEPTPPMIALDSTVLATGTTETSLYAFRGGVLHGYTAAAPGTIPALVKGTQGFAIGQMDGASDDIQLDFGTLTTSPGTFTVGTSPAFFVQGRFDIPDVSEYAVACVGFRTVAARATISSAATLLTAYAQVVAINSNVGTIELNTSAVATDTTTDTTQTWADGEEGTFRVNVSSAGVVTYQVALAGGTTLAAPTATAAHTVADGTVLQPFMCFAAAGATGGDSEAILVRLTAGLQ